MATPEIHFVISAPRSGSTWLTTALNQHPEIFATEHRLFGDFCEVWRNNDGSTTPRITFDKYAEGFAVHYFFRELGMDRESFLAAFERSFVNFLVGFASRRSSKRIVIDKITPYPGTTEEVVAKIRKLLPDSKIIQLVRDGRDVLTSGTYDWLLKDGHGTDRYRYHVENDPDVRLTRFFDDEVIDKWARNWDETIRAFDSVAADSRISYEGLKRDFASEVEKVIAAVGASREGIVEVSQKVSFQQMTGRAAGDDSAPTAKARKGIVGDWKEHFTRQDARLFDSICGHQLIELGYERNRGWIDALPESLL